MKHETVEQIIERQRREDSAAAWESHRDYNTLRLMKDSYRHWRGRTEPEAPLRRENALLTCLVIATRRSGNWPEGATLERLETVREQLARIDRENRLNRI